MESPQGTMTVFFLFVFFCDLRIILKKATMKIQLQKTEAILGLNESAHERI